MAAECSYQVVVETVKIGEMLSQTEIKSQVSRRHVMAVTKGTNRPATMEGRTLRLNHLRMEMSSTHLL